MMITGRPEGRHYVPYRSVL